MLVGTFSHMQKPNTWQHSNAQNQYLRECVRVRDIYSKKTKMLRVVVKLKHSILQHQTI